MDYIALGKRIRTARMRCDLTQTELAKRINCSYTFVGHIERGTRIPSVETLFLIAKTLGVSIDALLGLIDRQSDMNERARKILEQALTMAKIHKDEEPQL